MLFHFVIDFKSGTFRRTAYTVDVNGNISRDGEDAGMCRRFDPNALRAVKLRENKVMGVRPSDSLTELARIATLDVLKETEAGLSVWYTQDSELLWAKTFVDMLRK